MFVGILSKTWWTSLVKPDDRSADEGPVGRRPKEGQSEEESGEGVHLHPERSREVSQTEIEDDISERPSDRAPARPPISAAISEEESAGEPVARARGERESRDRPERNSRPDRGPRGGRAQRGDRRDRPERQERQPQNRPARDEDIEDDDDVIDVHRGDESAIGAEDPLALGYEFEPEPDAPRSGRSRRGEGRDSAPARARIQNAKEFFSTEILYRHDILERETRAQIASVYRIELKGNKGGVWTVTAADDLQIVNRREEAELVFTMQHRDFISLVNGDLNPQLAMLAQKIKVQGDYRKAVIAFSLLAPVSE